MGTPKKDYREKMREEYEKLASGGRTDFWAPRTITAKSDDGDRIRIIVPPYIKEDPEFGVVMKPWLEFRMYRIPGVKFADKPQPSVKTTACASDYGCPDPVAEAIAEMEEGNKTDRAAAKAMSAKQRFLALVVDLEKDPNKVMPWEFGPQVAEQIMKYATHRDYNLPWDNEEGHDLWVRKTGEKMDTEYDITPSPKPSPVENLDSLLEQAGKIDLARYVVIEAEETLEDLLDGKYDPEVAKERREARDDLHGRPLAYFLKSSGKGEDDVELDEDKPVRSRRSAVEKDEEPVEKKPARKAKDVVEEVEEPAASTNGSTRRRRKAEPEPEPTAPVLDDTVEFAGEDGEKLQGQIIELHLDDKDPYVTIDTGDGGEPWDVNVDEVTVVRRPAEPEAPEPEKTTRRRRSPAKAEEPKEEPAKRTSSIVDRVSELSRNARGEK